MLSVESGQINGVRSNSVEEKMTRVRNIKNKVGRYRDGKNINVKKIKEI